MSTPDERYNYETFRPATHIGHNGVQPAPGDDLSDHVICHLDGTGVTLGQVIDRPTVLETGSTTCPLYSANVSPMAELADRHPDVGFLVLYIREAHPGGRQGPHRHLDQKLAAAATLPTAVGETRTVVVDDHDGSLHRALGETPNSVVVLDERARVVTWMADADPAAVERVLCGLQAGELPTVTPRFRLPSPPVTLRALLRGGRRAVWDFVIGLPALANYRIGQRFRA